MQWKYNAIIKLSRPLSVVSEYGCNSVKLLLGTHIVFILHHLSSVYDSPKAYGQKFCNLAHWLEIVENIKMEIRPSFMSEHSSTINRFNIEIPLGLSPRPPLVARNTFFIPQLVGEWYGTKITRCSWLQSGWSTKKLLVIDLVTCRVLEWRVVCMEDNSFSAKCIINWNWRLLTFKVKYVS